MDASRTYSTNKYVVEAATGCLIEVTNGNPENMLRLENYKKKIGAEATGRVNTKEVKSPPAARVINPE